jgi:hypothetical protein
MLISRWLELAEEKKEAYSPANTSLRLRIDLVIEGRPACDDVKGLD